MAAVVREISGGMTSRNNKRTRKRPVSGGGPEAKYYRDGVWSVSRGGSLYAGPTPKKGDTSLNTLLKLGKVTAVKSTARAKVGAATDVPAVLVTIDSGKTYALMGESIVNLPQSHPNLSNVDDDNFVHTSARIAGKFVFSGFIWIPNSQIEFRFYL